MKNQIIELKNEIWGLLKERFPSDMNTSLQGYRWFIYKAFKIVLSIDLNINIYDTVLVSEYYVKNGVEKIAPYYDINNLLTLRAIKESLEKENIP